MKKIADLFISILFGLIILIFSVVPTLLSIYFRADNEQVVLIQGTFLYLSLIPAFIYIHFYNKKEGVEKIQIFKMNKKGVYLSLFFIPLFLVIFPYSIEGVNTSYIFLYAFLYLAVGLAEEVYFRGIILKRLKRSYSWLSVIILSSLIFALAHGSHLIFGEGLDAVWLTVKNAFIFGIMASEVAYLTDNLSVLILIHFLFDFEGAIITGFNAGINLYIKWGIMLLYIIYLTIIILIFTNKKNNNKEVDEEPLTEENVVN
ncbi:MAG: CPBP family intramembrane metalloprotease [Bacillales bacterium]|nr:CPBP family intramembrane metalloprotease [Bacillales bacterium]